MGADRLATAKAHAQDYAQTAQQRAAEHMERVSMHPRITHRLLYKFSGVWVLAFAVLLLFLGCTANF